MAGIASYFRHIGAPRPTRSRVTMTGSRFPGSRVIASDHLPRDVTVSSGIKRSSAIRLQLRGQPRNCLEKTYRIPLVSPFGHYRKQTWHCHAVASTVAPATIFLIAPYLPRGVSYRFAVHTEFQSQAAPADHGTRHREDKAERAQDNNEHTSKQRVIQQERKIERVQPAIEPTIASPR
jgi:hypothetical protein